MNDNASVISDLRARLEVAEAEHTIAKHRLATYEGSRDTRHYQHMKDKVDRTLTHVRIVRIAYLQAELYDLEAIQRAEDFDKRNPMS